MTPSGPDHAQIEQRCGRADILVAHTQANRRARRWPLTAAIGGHAPACSRLESADPAPEAETAPQHGADRAPGWAEGALRSAVRPTGTPEHARSTRPARRGLSENARRAAAGGRVPQARSRAPVRARRP